MNRRRIDMRASAARQPPPCDGSRVMFRALLLVSTLLSGGLAAQPADASLLITTTGTITSGSETGGLFGLPDATTPLTGSYTLTAYYNNLGPNYVTSGTGTFAQDLEIPGVTGYVTATVNGVSLKTRLTNSLGSLLIEDLFGLVASNEGYNGPSSTGAYVNVSQNLSCAAACVPYANLGTPFSYVLGSLDSGTDLYTFDGAGFPAVGTPTAMFQGTETSLSFKIPEPASWVVLATGLLGLGMLVRRRRV